MKRFLALWMSVLLLFPLCLPRAAASTGAAIVQDGETLYAYDNWLRYTVDPAGEACVREIDPTAIQRNIESFYTCILPIPPTLSGFPVRSISAKIIQNYRDQLLIPDSVRSVSLDFMQKNPISEIWFFSASVSVQLQNLSGVLDVYGFEQSGVESCASDTVSVHIIPGERFENGCVFTDTVVDIVAPAGEDHAFTIPDTLGGKPVTGIHCDTLRLRSDIRLLTVPKDARLLDLGPDDAENFTMGHITIRCPVNSLPNTQCFQYKIPCQKILPNGEENKTSYSYFTGDAFDDGDCTCTVWSIRDGEVYIQGWRETYDSGKAPYCWSPYSLLIPTQIDGLPVVSIGGLWGSETTYNSTDLHAIQLPETVHTIASRCFSYQTLRSINLNFVETLESMAFCDCALGNADLCFGKNLKRIGAYAFAYADSPPRSVTFDPDCPLETLEQGALSFSDGFDEPYWPDTGLDLILPQHIRTVETGAVSGVHRVVLPESTQSVAADGIYSAKEIVVLSRDVQLAERSLKCAMLYCYENSTAHQYATAHDIPFTLLDESLLLDQAEQDGDFLTLDAPATAEALANRLTVRGDAQIIFSEENPLTTGSTVTLRRNADGAVLRQWTIVCPADTDKDGKQNTWLDLRVAAQIWLKRIVPDEAVVRAADSNADGVIDGRDLLRMLRTVLRQSLFKTNA